MHRPLPVPVRSRDLLEVTADDRQLRRLAERGLKTRVAPGAYVDAEIWQRLQDRERYLTAAHARLLRLPTRVVASHWTAAAAWGFPVPDAWPRQLEITDPCVGKTTTTATIRRRHLALGPDDVFAWDGGSVTSPSRTAADLGLAHGFEAGVLAMDFGLHERLFTKADLLRQLQAREGAQRLRSALAAVEFADAGSESAGESFSRMAIVRGGFPAPVLQEQFFDSRGSIGRVDFWWEPAGIVGEFDGEQKYRDPAMTGGRTAADVVRDEKRRQARLDAHPAVNRVVRWDYRTARNLEELSARLRAVGLARSR